MCHFSSLYVLVTSRLLLSPCGSSAVQLSGTSQTRGTQWPLVQGSLGTTLLFHMISRHQASDPNLSNPPLSRILPIEYVTTEPARKDQVPNSQSKKRSGECAHKQHVPSLLIEVAGLPDASKVRVSMSCGAYSCTIRKGTKPVEAGTEVLNARKFGSHTSIK